MQSQIWAGAAGLDSMAHLSCYFSQTGTSAVTASEIPDILEARLPLASLALTVWTTFCSFPSVVMNPELIWM